MITPEEKKSIAKKIKALFAKTTEAGASEAEAMAAMAKGRELLEKYQLELSDLDIREEGTEKKSSIWSVVGEELYMDVGRYCECKPWRGSERKFHEAKRKNGRGWYENVYIFHFVGIKSDAVFAEWLLSALVNFVQNQQADFYLDNERVTPAQSNDFVAGCCKRIKERIQHEIAERKRLRPIGTGRDLVPLKNAMIQEKLNQLGVNLTSYKQEKLSYVDAHAYAAGMAAGNNVGLHRPMSYENSEPLKLGGK